MPQNPSPGDTQTSIDPSRRTDRGWIRVAKALLLGVALVYVAAATWDSINDVRYGRLAISPQAGWLIASAAVIGGTYALLINTWRYLLEQMSGVRLPFMVASRIWLVSNLGAYVPGRIWQIVQMGAMSRDAGVSGVTAGAAAVMNAAVNVAVGLAIGVIASAPMFPALFGAFAWAAWLVTGLAVAGLVTLPVLLPFVLRVARRKLGPRIPADPPPARALAVTTFANVIAWILYGAAFKCLALGILAPAPGTLVDYTASFASSYTAGYLAIMIPGGIGVREWVLTQVVSSATGMSVQQGQAIAIVSRLWLVLIQVLPALLFLAYRRRPADEIDTTARPSR